MSATIHYNPDSVEILDIITAASLCDPSLFLEKSIDNQAGQVVITCLAPNPGFSGSVGTVAELLIRPLRVGEISFNFGKDTQVLANDGLGTDVLRVTTDGYYHATRQGFVKADINQPLPVFSPSHPNSNRWYQNRAIQLSWPQLASGAYHYELTGSTAGDRDSFAATTISNYLDLTLTEDGVYFFTLQAQDEAGQRGPVSFFRIMVDATPPEPPEILASEKVVRRGDVVRFDFSARDGLSGVQPIFFVSIDGGVFLPVQPLFFVPFLAAKEYTMTVRVFDQANNFSDSSIVIKVVK